MRSARTPGVWAFIKVENHYRDARGVMKTVATVHSGDVAIARCHSVEDAQFIAAAPDMAAVAEATILFYTINWTDEKRKRWKELTGQEEATTKILCNFARFALANAGVE